MHSLHPAKQPKVFSPFPGIFWALSLIIFEIFFEFFQNICFFAIFFEISSNTAPLIVLFFEPFVLFFFENFQKISKFFSNCIKIFNIFWINLNIFWNILFYTCRISTNFSLRLKFTCRISTGFSLLSERMLDPPSKTFIRGRFGRKDLIPFSFYWRIAIKSFQKILQNVSRTGSVFRKASKLTPYSTVGCRLKGVFSRICRRLQIGVLLVA